MGGKEFEPRIAVSPNDLLDGLLEEGLVPPSMAKLDELTCWIRTKTATQDLWMVIDLEDPIHFQKMFETGYIGQEVNDEGVGGCAVLEEDGQQQRHVVVDMIIEPGRTNTFASIASDRRNENNRPSRPIDVQQGNRASKENKSNNVGALVTSAMYPSLINNMDPFTSKKLDTFPNDQLVYLEIFEKASTKKHLVAVHFESLKTFLKEEIDEGSIPNHIVLKNVLCKDSKTRNFVFDKFVWSHSIFPQSNRLEILFHETNSNMWTRQRELRHSQKTFPHLWKKIQFWLADMMNFSSDKDARVRLEFLPKLDEGIPLYFNEFYFSLNEARYLLDRSIVPFSGETVGEAYQKLLATRSNQFGATICTSSELCPFFRKIFDLPKNFRESADFKNDYKTFKTNWKQDKDVQRQVKKAGKN
jgi:hypothetical protein